jgi:hypothetical protein
VADAGDDAADAAPDAPAGVSMAASAGDDAATEDPASACGRHGVFGIRITGASTDASGEDVTTVCTPGVFKHEVPAGTWTFTVHALDAAGRLKQAQASAGGTGADGAMLNVETTGVAVGNGATASFEVTLVPLPECADGVDNDGDGRVDGDDPDCTHDFPVLTECDGRLAQGLPCRVP